MRLTRKIVILEVEEEGMLDYNYHYELMKELYKSFDVADKDKSKEIHDIGYIVDKKKYKLFTSQLFIENASYKKDGIELGKRNKVKLTISGEEKIIKNIILGIFKRQSIKLFDIIFKVKDLESDKNIRFDDITIYKVRNPIVATIQNENREIVFVSPYQEKFFEILANNLKRKYKLIYKEEYNGELYFDIEDIFTVKKRLISNIKEKGVIIGYNNFELYIQATKEMQKVAYYCGVGSNNSLGMGMLTYITSRRE